MKFLATAALLLLSTHVGVIVGQETILNVVGSRPEFSTLAAAAAASPEVAAYLGDSATSATLFAPVDDAFAALGNDTIVKFTTNPSFAGHLACILTAHVIDGEQVMTETYVNGTLYSALEPDFNLTILTDAPNNKVVGEANEANLIADADIKASNGVIQTADSVLLPDCAVSSIWDQIEANEEFFTKLLEYVERLGLVNVLNNTAGDPTQALTIFAPTNAAFDAIDPLLLATFEGDDDLLAGFITYHLMPDIRYVESLSLIETSFSGMAMNFDKFDNGTVAVNDGSTLFDGSTDVLASNGLIHIINDKALVPPTLQTFIEALPEKFSSLQAAFETYQFTFDPAVELTLFAPNNEALASVEYPFPINEAYAPLIVYVLFGHVVEGALNSSTVFANGTTSLESGGEPIAVDPAAQTLGTVGASVVQGDVFVSLNSVIHEVDKVLVPESLTKNMLEILDDSAANNGTGTYSLFLSYVNASNFTDLLTGTNEEGLTIFAPDNQAFQNLENFAPGVLEALQNESNVEFVKQTIAYHVGDSNIVVVVDQEPINISRATNLWGDVMYSGFSEVSFQSESFSSVGVSRMSGEVIGTSNGVIQPMIDAILPLSVQEVGTALNRVRAMDIILFAPRFGRGGAYNSLYYDISDPMNFQAWTLVLPNNTVFTNEFMAKFAPGDNAWDSHALEIIFYHVFPRQYIKSENLTSGEYASANGPVNVTVGADGVKFGNANIVEADFFSWNGVTHISDGFVGPDWVGKTILDVIAENEQMTAVSGLVNQFPDIVAALNNSNVENTLTLFAPSDDVFAALNASGQTPPMEQIETLLLQHVFPVLVFANSVEYPSNITSLAQMEFELTNTTEGFKLGDAFLISNVIFAENGLIYLIDSILAAEPTSPPSAAPVSPPPTSSPTTSSPVAPTKMPTDPQLASPSPTAPISSAVSNSAW
eukprot:CAMPEP_0194029924 /NCGR_PEP_ID=MMETSP0009_2-20130614/3548_1 /TAXON_ID=210454 /ORGANISM="Grammatophora oceanica, Strain CCMP 410" /LENGTH=936 /DNA_ID=CAMNT_0038669747 /DNA_START=76 /DNA_END=2883 /DNA_ORIENTATION=+